MVAVVVRVLMTSHLLHLSPAGRGRADGAGAGARAGRDTLAPSPPPSPRAGMATRELPGNPAFLPAPPPLARRGRTYSLPSPPRRGKRSNPKTGEGSWVGGRLRESEPAETPPHPTCFAPLTLRSQVDLSPQAGRGGASRTAVLREAQVA